MNVKVYNLEGKETGQMELSDRVFGVKVKSDVAHEVFTAMVNNQREAWADTKKRGEVRGGGRKPWPQKGTGRARHGSIRSPIWKGGGVTFGPLSERNYKSKINKNKRRLAARMCLSDRAKNGAIIVVEDFNFSEPKTKLFANFLRALPVKGKTALVLTSDKEENAARMAKNLPSARISRASDVNVMDILSTGAIIVSKAGINKLEEMFVRQ